MATNPDELFADLIPQGGGAVFGPPPKASDKEPPTTWRTLTSAEATASGLNPGKVWQVSSKGETKAIGDAAADATLTQTDRDDLKAEALSKLRLGASLIKRSQEGYFTTGFGAGLAGMAGGTQAYGVKQDTETLKNAGALQRVIELSKKTGKNPLTPLSNSDFQALANSIANLDTSQSDDQYQRNVQTLLDIYKRTYTAAGGSQKDIDAIMAGPNAPPVGGGGAEGEGPPPGIAELSDDQKKAYSAFLAVNPNPDEGTLKTFLEKLTGKTVPNAGEIAKALKAGRTANMTVQDLSYQDKLKKRIADEDKLGLGDNAATTLAMQGGTLQLSDEAAGVGNAAANVLTSPFTGKFNPLSAYTFGRDAERMRIDNAREQLGYGGTAIELVSGAAAGGPTAALEAFAPKQAAIAAGKASALGGALAGYGSGEGAQDSAVRGAGGAFVGYGTGRYASALVDKVLPRRLRAPQGMAPDVAEAAKAEGVDLIRPMVDPSAISDYGALESNVYSQPIIRGAAGRVRGQIEDRAVALGGTGAPMDEGTAGEAMQSAGRRFIQRSKGVANTLYNRARSLAGDARFEPKEAIAQVDAEIAALQPNSATNAGEIKFLEGLKNDLSSAGGKTVEELRQLRTSLRGRVTEQNLSATQAEARAIRALDATQQDVASNVPAAASAYRRADTYYRERQTHIDDIIRRITGGKVGATDFEVSGERAFQRIKAMASPGGDGRRLGALMRDLEPSERQDIAATIATQIGRRAPDEPFSTALFLSQTRKLSPSARKTIFGPDGAQSIDNLRLLSRKLEEAEKDINRSRSATVLERQGIRQAARAFIAGLAGIGGQAATGSISGGVAGLAVAGAAMGTSAARRVLSARAMVNPRVSRWLAEAADASTPQQAKEATRKLSVIISREPALAHELQGVYDFLERRLELPLAADPNQRGNANNEQQ